MSTSVSSCFSGAEYIRREHGTPRSIAAWRAYHDGAKSGSDEWQTATYFLADELVRAGDHGQALPLYVELFDFYQAGDPPGGTHVLLSIAETQRAAGQRDEARRSLARAEPMLAAEAKQFKDPRDLDYLKSWLAKLREWLAD